MENVGQKIRKLRELRNYTQEYMALNLNVTQTAYCKMEKEESRLSIERLKKIADVLDIEPLQLLTFNENLFIPKKRREEVPRQVHDKVIYFNPNKTAEDDLTQKVKNLENEIYTLRNLIGKLSNHLMPHALAG